MAEFRIRVFKERASHDHNDYIVSEVDTIEEAATKLALLQIKADLSWQPIRLSENDGICVVNDDGSQYTGTSPFCVDPIELNEPETIMGYIQVDESGTPVRHLSIEIPAGEEPLGDPLDIDWPDEDDVPEDSDDDGGLMGLEVEED